MLSTPGEGARAICSPCAGQPVMRHANRYRAALSSFRWFQKGVMTPTGNPEGSSDLRATIYNCNVTRPLSKISAELT